MGGAGIVLRKEGVKPLPSYIKLRSGEAKVGYVIGLFLKERQEPIEF